MTEQNTRPLRDVVADGLRAQIVSGALSPGTRVREERIAIEHGVSRVPVREALQRLEQEGFLVLTPRRSATVATPSARRVLELMEIRTNLEILGLAVHGPTAGSDAHLAVLDTSDMDNVVLGAPSVVATVRRGRVVHRAEGAEVHPAVSP